jgi:hypothetical protein
MVSQSKSKAQRRAESQQRAAERRAAELRAKRMRTGLRVGGGLLAIGLVVVLIVVLTGGSTGVPPSQTNPHISTVPIPASMKASWVQPTQGAVGPEAIPLGGGTKLADLSNAATGQTVQGIQCQDGEQTVTHVHTHLTIFVNGKAMYVPYGVGIPGFQAISSAQGPFVQTGSCFYWLHTHATDGIIHVESPSTSLTFHLGQFFAEWGLPLSSTQVGPDQGHVTVFFNGKLYKGDPATLPLGAHYQIQLDVGTPIVAPVTLKSWGQL